MSRRTSSNCCSTNIYSHAEGTYNNRLSLNDIASPVAISSEYLESILLNNETVFTTSHQANVGWICPKCGLCLSPNTKYCPHCEPNFKNSH